MREGRFVSYIFRYRQNNRCENTGFIKIQRVYENETYEARIQIGLRMLKNKSCKCRVYLIFNSNRARFLTEIHINARERDTIITKVSIPWDRPFGEVVPFDAYDGLFFACDDGDTLVSAFDSAKIDIPSVMDDINRVAIQIPDKEVYIPTIELNTEDNSVDDFEKYTEGLPPEEEVAPASDEDFYLSATKADICEEIIEKHQKLPLFPDSQFIECVKIVPQDIGKLAIGNWKLGANSFLSHGYYHYKYIMLGKVRLDENEAYVIGVPGVFTNKERYLANLFGFSVFIPARKTNLLTGNFGYWISEISNE